MFAHLLLAIVIVSPGDDIAAKSNAAAAGDTISFSAGTYFLPGKIALPANRIYQGNGAATISGPSSKTPTFLFDGVTGVEVTGFTFTGTDIQLNNCQVNIHGNTFTTIAGDSLFATGMHDSHIDGNTFTNVSGSGIMAYPGNNNTFDGNTFTNVFEPIHAMGGQNGNVADTEDVSQNVITGASRIGIELQNTMAHLSVNHNYIAQWNPKGNVQSDGNASHMAISCATGGSAAAPFANQGNNIEIASNTLLLNGVPGQTAGTSLYALTAIETMGTRVSIHNNYCNGCGLALMNGSFAPGVTSSNNTWICVNLSGNDNCPWPIAPVQSIGDKVFQWNDSSAPAAPSIAATVAAAAPAMTNAPAAVVTPATSTPAPLPTTAPAAATPSITHRITVYSDGSVQEN